MSTLIRTAPAAFTGPRVGDLPVIFENIPLHSAGVAGYNHRFIASDLGDVATEIDSWAPVTDGGTLALAPDTGAASTAKPVVHEESGEKMARFDGVDDWLVMGGIYGNTISSLVTVAAVMRCNKPAGTAAGMMSNQAVSVSRAAAGGVQFGGFGTISDKAITGQFRVVILTSNVAGSTYRGSVDGEVLDLSTTVAGSRFYFGRVPGGGTAYTAMDLVEAITWPSDIGSAGHVDVYAAMKERYPGFIL